MTTETEKVQDAWKKYGFHWSRAKKLATAGVTPEALLETPVNDIESQSGLDEEFLESALKELKLAMDATGMAPSSSSTEASSTDSETPSDGEETPSTETGSEPTSEITPAAKPAAKKGKKTSKKKAVKGKKAAKQDKKKPVDDPRTLTAKQKLARALAITDKMTRQVFGHETKIVGIASQMQELVFKYISFGLLALDQILGGGVLRGRFTAIVGPEQTCKTLLAMLAVAQAQREDPNCICVWIDQENTFDPRWAALHGIDLDRLLIIGPEILEDQMDILERVLWETAPAVVVYDSVGAAVSYQELETSKGTRKSSRDETMAMTARVLSKFFRRFTYQVAQTAPAFIFITHLYQKIGVMFGPDTEIKGGNALKAYCSAILSTSRRKGDQDKKIKIQMPDGRVIEIFPAFELVVGVHKTKQSPTEGHRVAIPFIHGKGLSNIDSVIEMAFGAGVIQKNGEWYTHYPSFNDAGVDSNGWVSGKQNCIDFIKAHPDIFEAILVDVGLAMAQEDRHIEASDVASEPDLADGTVEVPMP